MKLEILKDSYKIIKLKPSDKVPLELLKEEIYSITRTEEELSILAKSSLELKSDRVEDNWRIIKIVGILDFSLIGILSKISTILAQANIGIFVISTYNTDYILVKDKKLKQAIKVLEENGYDIIEN